MQFTRKTHILFVSFLAAAAFALVLATGVNTNSLLGRILQGDELLRIQVESDFDRDGDIDFLDFTVFSAFYEENA